MIKRKTLGVVVGAVLVCSLTGCVDQYGDFTYEINSSDTNTVTITDYTGAGGAVVIQADKESDMGVVIDVMDQVQLAGAPIVDISTNKK